MYGSCCSGGSRNCGHAWPDSFVPPRFLSICGALCNSFSGKRGPLSLRLNSALAARPSAACYWHHTGRSGWVSAKLLNHEHCCGPVREFRHNPFAPLVCVYCASRLDNTWPFIDWDQLSVLRDELMEWAVRRPDQPPWEVLVKGREDVVAFVQKSIGTCCSGRI